MPWVVRKNGDKWCVYKKGTSESRGCHASRSEAVNQLRALYKNVEAADLQASAEAISLLQGHAPTLVTLPGVSIVKTGIEYPLSTGPRTFTAEDLLDAVKAQDDPAIPQPRIWLGHPDDDRLHGDRSGVHPSGEPAIGKVTNMRLEEDGHKIVGDLAGVPLWFARIMSSAFPSRSIEGRSNWKTPTGNKWRFVINELALLGVVWPGVNTIEDIATLYTNEGPANISVIEASEETPLTSLPREARTIAAGLSVEDFRRQLYQHLRGDPQKKNWWLRQIYVDPSEAIVDDDVGGIHAINWHADNGEFRFGEPQQKKIEYVNASDGGIRPVTVINEGRPFVAQFDSKADADPDCTEISVNLTAGVGEDFLSIKLGATK